MGTGQSRSLMDCVVDYGMAARGEAVCKSGSDAARLAAVKTASALWRIQRRINRLEWLASRARGIEPSDVRAALDGQWEAL